MNGKPLHFRGLQIRKAVLEALMTIGMKRASDVILTGCSAGGVATFIHADYVQSILPSGVKYAAMADAGYVKKKYYRLLCMARESEVMVQC